MGQSRRPHLVGPKGGLNLTAEEPCATDGTGCYAVFRQRTELVYIYRTDGYNLFCVISVFRHEVDYNCALLGYYAASGGDFLPAFRGNISVPSSRAKNLGLLTDRLSRNVGKALIILTV